MDLELLVKTLSSLKSANYRKACLDAWDLNHEPLHGRKFITLYIYNHALSYTDSASRWINGNINYLTS